MANFVNTKLYKNPEKWPKPWQIGSHLKALSESYLMSTNMTGFRWFSKILRSCTWDKSSLSIVRVKSPVVFHINDKYIYDKKDFHPPNKNFLPSLSTSSMVSMFPGKLARAVRKPSKYTLVFPIMSQADGTLELLMLPMAGWEHAEPPYCSIRLKISGNHMKRP